MSADLPRHPRVVLTTKQYEKDARRVISRGYRMDHLVSVVATLRERQSLEVQHRDHALKGKWRGYRECHIQADWLLIYRLDEESVYLARTGTHADLFE